MMMMMIYISYYILNIGTIKLITPKDFSYFRFIDDISKENENVDGYLDIDKAEKTVERDGNSDTNCSRNIWNNPLGSRKKTGETEY